MAQKKEKPKTGHRKVSTRTTDGSDAKKTQKRVKKAEKEEVRTLRIAQPQLDIVEMHIKSVEGSTLLTESKKGAEALMFDLWGESMDPTRKGGLMKQRPGGTTTKKVKKERTDEVLQKEFEYSQYRVLGEKDSWGLPAGGFRASMVDAAKNKAMPELNGTDIERNVWILNDCMSTFGDALIRIKCSQPHPQNNRLGGDLGINSGATGAPRVICRAEFDHWEATLRIEFNSAMFSAEEIVNLVEYIGRTDGTCGKRRGKGYNHGMYYVCENPAPKVYSAKKVA